MELVFQAQGENQDMRSKKEQTAEKCTDRSIKSHASPTDLS